MKLNEVVRTSAAVTAAAGRLEKVRRITTLLRELDSARVETVVAMLSGRPRQGRVGLGPAAVREALDTPAAGGPALSLEEVDRALDAIASAKGPGAGRRRVELFSDLMARATARERGFLARLVLGELRQGALEGLMVEAVADAAEQPVERVRHAVMVAGGLPPVARALDAEGAAGLDRFRARVGQPLQPMLAQSAGSVDEALERLGTAALEWKLDGARVQVHKSGGDVRVFTRRLRDVTAFVPEIVEMVRGVPARELILDGEAIVLGEAGRPQPFQVTMGRFGSRTDVARLREKLPLDAFFFDCIHVDGNDLAGEPQSGRFEALRGVLPDSLLIPRLVTASPEEARRFLGQALARGHEGVMAKSPEAPYAAGARGRAWLKVKVEHTLDLVVLAAEWGHGRRHGWLSNIHLGARDARSGGFVMVGKTFKGMTDDMLAWQTKAFLDREVAREGHIVRVRPELVVEVAINGVQRSSRYPGGMALRFARVRGYRPDKGPQDADTIDTVHAILEPAGVEG